MPVIAWVLPGNRNDQALVEQVERNSPADGLGGETYVVDSGFSGRDSVRAPRSGGGHYIAGVKLPSGMPRRSPGRAAYRQVKDNLRVNEVR